MSAVLAHRQSMHGPLWTADQERTHVQLWAPNHRRDEWALGWTTIDEDGEVIDSGYERRPDLGAFAALVPISIRRPVSAVLNAASAWDPTEACDHSRATSYSVLDDDRRICGYCGRVFRSVGTFW